MGFSVQVGRPHSIEYFEFFLFKAVGCLIKTVFVPGLTTVSGQTSFLLPKSHLCSDTHPHTQGTRSETVWGKSPALWRGETCPLLLPQHVTHSAVVEQVALFSI